MARPAPPQRPAARLDARRIPLPELPAALAEVRRGLAPGDAVELRLPTSPADRGRQRAVIVAAAFAPPTEVQPTCIVTATLALPDHVGPRMRLLCCGLNPSVHAATAGVGFVTASNRFWRAAAAAGIATTDRDPLHLLHHDHVGMTDLVARPTPKADVLTTQEYRAGLARLDDLCAWLTPAAVAFVGLAGWRAAVDRKATAGWQERRVGGRPAYVLPSTSGLNAGTRVEDLVDHLRAAISGPPDAHVTDDLMRT